MKGCKRYWEPVLPSPTPQLSKLQADTRPPEVPAVELRNPHPIVKAALAAKSDVPNEYGKMQFRWGGYVDIRVSRPLMRRALKILDTLFKQLEKEGLQVQITARESNHYQG
jgi:hypothetical protein